jgi:hypothetical protein
VDISGTATLNGTLNLILVNGFLPGVGDSFNILNYGSITQVESPPGSGQFTASDFAVVNRPAGTTSSTAALASSYGVTLSPLTSPPPSSSPTSVIDPIGAIETISEISAISTTIVVATINNDPIVNFSAPPGSRQGDPARDAPASTGAGGIVAGTTQGDQSAQGDPSAQSDEESDESTPGTRRVVHATLVDLDELGEAPILMCQ